MSKLHPELNVLRHQKGIRKSGHCSSTKKFFQVKILIIAPKTCCNYLRLCVSKKKKTRKLSEDERG